MGNPFYNELDWAFRGKVVEVGTQGFRYRGVLNRIEHSKGSVLLHDAVQLGPQSEPQEVGSVFIRTVDTIVVVSDNPSGRKVIDYAPLSEVVASPYYPKDLTEIQPVDTHLRGCYRNQFAGSFPVCRTATEVESEPGSQTGEAVEVYELINGHKRMAAALSVGLSHHPVEVIECSDSQAESLVQLAHRDEDTGSTEDNTSDTDA